MNVKAVSKGHGETRDEAPPGRSQAGAGHAGAGHTGAGHTGAGHTRSGGTDSSRSGGWALGKALALSDEQSTLVVLQGNNSDSPNESPPCAPTSFMSQFLLGQPFLSGQPFQLSRQFLLGQQAVCLILQQPSESVDDLHQRLTGRLLSLESPPDRLLWIAGDATTGQRLLRLYASLTRYCKPGREVLLASRDGLVKVRPVASVPPCLPSRAPSSPSAPPLARAPRGRVASDPPRSAVQWSLPAQPEPAPAQRRRIAGSDDAGA